VLVDAKRARVVGFVHPREEAAPAEGALSPERAREAGVRRRRGLRLSGRRSTISPTSARRIARSGATRP
jgi:hypothetical protein